MSDPEEDLLERLEELESAVEELREELRPPRGPLGLPRPPRPGEVLRFTDEYAIPAAIAVLEANVRMLELLRGILRAGRTADSASEARERAADLGRESLTRLEDALENLSEAMEAGDLPREPESRRLLEEARELNRRVREELRAEGDPGSESGEVGTSETTRDDDGVEIDVEAELESIKEEVRDETGDGESKAGKAENGRTTDEGDDSEEGTEGGRGPEHENEAGTDDERAGEGEGD